MRLERVACQGNEKREERERKSEGKRSHSGTVWSALSPVACGKQEFVLVKTSGFAKSMATFHGMTNAHRAQAPRVDATSLAEKAIGNGVLVVLRMEDPRDWVSFTLVDDLPLDSVTVLGFRPW